MYAKITLFILFIPFLAFSQNENFNTTGKFQFIDTLQVNAKYSINPGQLSKDGTYFLTGLYYDNGEDSTYSQLFKIELNEKATAPKLIGFKFPIDYQEFFQVSETNDKKTIVTVGNNFKGWAGNDLFIAEKDENGDYTQIRKLDELNSEDTVDAYPWISGDGLRIYFIKNEVLYYSSRKSRTSLFDSPQLVAFNGSVETPAISIWLSNDEKKLYYISRNIIYEASRKKRSHVFNLPKVFTNEFKEFEFISGISFTPNQKEMYLYYSGETVKILHYKLK